MSEHEVVDPYDITVRSSGLGRRRLTEKVFGALGVAAAIVAVGILALVLGTVVIKGFSQLNLDLLTKSRPLFGEQGGIADALIGSAIIVGICALMAIPFAVLVAIYMSEYASPRVSRSLRIVLDVLNGVPAIVVGIFVFGLLVVGNGQKAIYGSFALAILMIPMVARATQEVLEIVPRSPARRQPRARRHEVAHRLEHHPAERDRRHPHRRRDRHRTRRRRDGAAAVHDVDRGEHDRVRPVAGAADAAGRDLRVLGVARPGRAGARLGGRARADPLRAPDEHPRQGVRRPEAPAAPGELRQP